MKKIAIIASIIVVIIVAGIFLINANVQDEDKKVKSAKVGVVLIGERDDRSWTQTHYEALEKTRENLNLTMVYRENVPEDETSKASFEELIDEGCEIIISNSFGYGEYELEVAKEHPEVFFFHATGVQQEKNLTTYFGRIYQMRYLAGIVAGLQTESNEIGYVAAYPIPEVNRGINAFTLGVRSVNPDATVYVEFCYSWNSDDAAKSASENLCNRHPKIDLLTLHSDSLAVCEYAEEHGIWSIGYNKDNSEIFPNSFLTAPIWHWENYYEPKLRECMQGKFQSGHYWEGADTGVVGLAPLTKNVKPETQEIVDREMEQLVTLEYDVFYGPIKDNQGNIRIPEGESMTDDAMLNEFDWYVEGVVVEGE